MSQDTEKIDMPRIDPPGPQEPPRQDPPAKEPPESDPPSREPPVREPGKSDQEKIAAGRASVKYVSDGQIVGLGTGSTAVHAIAALGERVGQGLKILGIPTSQRSKELAEKLGIPLTTLDQHHHIDVTIDGADEADPSLNLIKGGGGALLREKIIASASRFYVIVADSSKRVTRLGRFPLPVEVIPFAQALVAAEITRMGASVTLRQYAYGNPYVTDEGHHILDCRFGEMADPAAVGRVLDTMPGVVEHGLFIGMADVIVFGEPGGVVEQKRPVARSGAN